MIDRLLRLLAILVLASLNYKLGELTRAQQSIAHTRRLQLGLELDVMTRPVDAASGRPYAERN